MLRQFLHEVAKDTTKAPYLRRSVLCKTLGGLDCDHLSISNFEVDQHAKLGLQSMYPSTTNYHPIFGTKLYTRSPAYRS